MRSGWSSVNIAPHFPDKSICAYIGAVSRTVANANLTKLNEIIWKKPSPGKNGSHTGRPAHPWGSATGNISRGADCGCPLGRCGRLAIGPCGSKAAGLSYSKIKHDARRRAYGRLPRARK